MTAAKPGRFYKDVSAAPQDIAGGGGFTILLDGKPIRTPARAAFAVPTRALAKSIAEEWRAQAEKIDPRTMPLTTLANTAIDGVAKERDAVIAALARFGEHDLLCYRSPDEKLGVRERAGWDPLLAWARDRTGAALEVTVGIAHVEQAAQPAFHAALAALDAFTLAGLSPIVTITGSLVLGLALIEGRIDARAAFALARIDEAYQAEKWGTDAEAMARDAALEREMDNAARFIALARG